MKISVIIPAYNEDKSIMGCIDSILKNSYVHKEIIVINDCSTDNILRKLENIKDVIIINNENKLGIVGSIKKGIEKSKGDIIIKLNADCIVEGDFLKKSAKHFEIHEVVAITGNYKPLNKTWITDSLAIIDDFFLNISQRKLSLSKLSGPFWAARKETLLKLSLWSKNKVNDEGNIYLEIKDYGPVIYDSSMIIKGTFPDSFGGVLARKFKWGVNSIHDHYFKHMLFWIRPLYFLIAILIFSPNNLISILALSITMLPLITLFCFSLFKYPFLSFFIPFIFIFSEFAWLCGTINALVKKVNGILR
jgi:cellulose synthase/poly-beta-1,6-N-acetylglucosamine synthase-like glycosyltransferase